MNRTGRRALVAKYGTDDMRTIGAKIGDEYGEVLDRFLDTRVMPAVKHLADNGEHPGELLAAFIAGCRTSLDGIEATIDAVVQR